MFAPAVAAGFYFRISADTRNFMSEQIFYLQDLPRQLQLPFRLRNVSFMKDHIYINRNRTLHVDLITISMNHGEKTSRGLRNGQLYESNSPLPHLGVIPMGTRLHTLQARKHDELIFTFTPESFDAVTQMLHPTPGYFHLNTKIQSLIDEVSRTMESIFVPGSADRMDLLFIQLISEIMLEKSLHNSAGLKEPKIYEIISYMNVHFTECITLEDICRKYAISARTLYRHWRENFPDTPADFLLKKRLEYAEHLLLTTDKGVQETAVSCGFSNPVYFTQCFRRKYGMSPSAFRKKHFNTEQTTAQER